MGLLAAVTMAASATGSGKAVGRHRLAEALRANLGRRKAQKRDRKRKSEAELVEDETARPEAALGGPGQSGSAAASQED